MPRGDGTGPMGMGANTGRGAGYCAGAQQYGNARPRCGAGLGLGRNRGVAWNPAGGGAGMCRGFGLSRQSGGMTTAPVAASPEMDKQRLRNQAAALQTALDNIANRLAALEAAEVGQ